MLSTKVTWPPQKLREPGNKSLPGQGISLLLGVMLLRNVEPEIKDCDVTKCERPFFYLHRVFKFIVKASCM